jgi:hypothetical protein
MDIKAVIVYDSSSSKKRDTFRTTLRKNLSTASYPFSIKCFQNKTYIGISHRVLIVFTCAILIYNVKYDLVCCSIADDMCYTIWATIYVLADWKYVTLNMEKNHVSIAIFCSHHRETCVILYMRKVNLSDVPDNFLNRPFPGAMVPTWNKEVI